MNYAIVKALILKDWYLQRWPIVGCLGSGLLALTLLAMAGQGAMFAGTILLITTMIIAGVSVAAATMAGERKEHTLAFVMSLPVSSSEYTVSKMVGGSLLVLLPWTFLIVGSILVITTSGSLPDGLIPYTVLLLTELLASAFVLLAVALVSESQAWTLSVMVCGNLFINGFIFYLSRVPEIKDTMNGPVPVWNETALLLLAGEIAVIVAALSLAFYLQSRKTDFL